jgi:hypothetical protein
MNCQFKTNYSISNTGVVTNTKTGTQRITSNSDGYRVLTIDKKKYYIHRLVAQCFIPNPLNLPMVNHIDGDRCNNHYTNLEWITAKGNTQHSMILYKSTGRYFKQRRYFTYEEEDSLLEMIKTGLRTIDIAKYFEVDARTIRNKKRKLNLVPIKMSA